MICIDLPGEQKFTAAISPNKAIPPEVMLIVGVSPWATIKTDRGINCKEIAYVSDSNSGRGGKGDKVPLRCYHVRQIPVKYVSQKPNTQSFYKEAIFLPDTEYS